MKGVVAYQGEPGAYAHEACRKFLPDFERINRPTFEAVADAVLAGEAELGMLPIENNSAGQVPGNRELIVRKGLFVREEVELPIILHLMAVPGARLEEIETVVSHPIALAQCHNVLERLSAKPEEAINTAVGARLLADSGARLEEIETVVSHPIALAQCHNVLERLSAKPEEAINTAVGARLLADSGDRKKAAVASEAAALANGLTILCRNVHDRADNATTFCIVARDAGEEEAGEESGTRL